MADHEEPRPLAELGRLGDPRLKGLDWDFKDDDTRELTHGLHPYPARMVPQIARRLIKTFSEKGDLVYDPMCGSGTVLTEARLVGRNSVGVDINPHALLLAKVKSTPLDPAALGRWLDLLREELPTLDSASWAKIDVKPPELDINMEFWFKPQAIRGLAFVKAVIDKKVTDPAFREFFYVPFSLAVRYCSNTRNGEFKLYRMATEKLDKHDPNPATVFLSFAADATTRMRDFYRKAPEGDLLTLPMRGDARVTSLFGRADCIVTSPPYGDSQTTVAYGQYSRLSAEWLNMKDVRQVDRLSIGGKTAKKENGLKSDSLTQVLSVLESKDRQRAGEVKSFFLDLHDCLLMMAESLRPEGYACIVIGNRTVKGVRIPTDRIIVELGRSMGLAHEGTITREISSKTMPLEVSPTNVAGETESSMREEHIVVLRRV